MKKILMILGMVLLVGGAALASNTRVLTMGDNNLILLDDANISLFPSRIVDYPNLALAEMSSDDMRSLGIHWKFSKDKPCVLGTYFYNDGFESHEFAPVAPPLSENQRIDLYWGTKLGNGSKLGLHIGRRSSSEKTEAVNNKNENSLSVTRFGVGYTPDGDKYDVAAELEFLGWKNQGTKDDNTAYDITDPKGNRTLSLVGRTFREMNDNTTLVPHVGLEFGKYEYDQYSTTSPYAFVERVKDNVLSFTLGSGIEYTPSANVLAVMDIGIMYDKVKTTITDDDGTATERTVSTWSFPFFKVGFDASVFRWMDVRFGTTSYWNSEKDDRKTANREDIRKWPDNETYLGFGLHWSRLHIDLQTDPELFLDGFNFISGQSNRMNFRLSAVYEMM